MEGKLLLMFLDLLVLSALGTAIYYLRQVSSSIKIIREGKTELQQVLQQLNIHISNAQNAIENMRKTADEKGKFLQKQADTASAIIDELQYIQKAADNVALRLEKLTGQASVNLQTDEVESKPAATMSKAEKELADAMSARRKRSGE
jgi:hypothetical protein